jgi:hypothetical protein
MYTNAQSLSVTLVGSPDTSGISGSEWLNLERELTLSLPSVSSGGDTLVVELGPEAGSYDLLTRKFPLGQTGTFVDGCSLNFTAGVAEVGLGSYTGLATFYVRSYLASAGVGTAISVDNE